MEKKIIITNCDQPSLNPDANLIKVVAQGWHWFEQLKSGEIKMAKEIATMNGTDFANVTRTMQLAFLAPDIVEAILEGRQPLQLTSRKLNASETYLSVGKISEKSWA